MMSGHTNNHKKNKGGSKGTGRHKPDDEMFPLSTSAQENTNMLKAALKVGITSETSSTSPKKDSPLKDSPLLKVEELFPAASARVEERIDYWQEDEVQKFMQSNPQVESVSSIDGTHNYLAGTFNTNSPDRLGSRSVLTTVTEFFRGSLIAASSGSRNGGRSYYDTTTSPSEETETWTMLLPLKRFVLRTITVILYICDFLGIKAALTEKTAGIAQTYVERVFSFPSQFIPQLCSFVRTAQQSICSMIYYLFTWWWKTVLWCICLPYHITVFTFQIIRSIFFTVLVLFLNKAPGGYLVLKALNGHIPRH